MESNVPLLIPIFGIVFSFVTPIAIILIIFLNKTKQEKYRNEVLKASMCFRAEPKYYSTKIFGAEA